MNTRDTHIGHDNDDDVLLKVELAGAEVELEAKEIPDAVGEDKIPQQADGVGNQLDDISGDGDTGVAQREEHVDARADRAQNQADHPRADRVGRQVDIVVADRRTHLGVRRVVLDNALLNGEALLDVARVDGVVDVVELLDRQVGIQVVHALKVLEVVQGLDARGDALDRRTGRRAAAAVKDLGQSILLLMPLAEVE